MSRWEVVSSMRCRNVPAGAFERADVQFLQVRAQPVPGAGGGGLDDPDQE
jgi:hypothetical protein